MAGAEVPSTGSRQAASESAAVEILTIGDELLLGFTLDTNGAYLARKLAEDRVRLGVAKVVHVVEPFGDEGVRRRVEQHPLCARLPGSDPKRHEGKKERDKGLVHALHI